MNRKELAKQLASKTNLRPESAERLILAIENTITKALEGGKKVVYSNFGTFYTVHYPSKIIYHPVLGKAKQMVMLPTNAAKWMPSGNIKDLANSETGIDDIGSLVAHGIHKITHDFNQVPKSSSFKKNIPTIEHEKSQNIMPSVKPKAEKVDLPILAPTFPQPSKVSNTIKNNVTTDDEAVIIPIRSVKKETFAATTNVPVQEKSVTRVNTYENINGDDNKIEPTLENSGKISPDSKKSFLGRIFKRTNVVDEVTRTKPAKTEKVSLKDAGIFSKEISIPSDNHVEKMTPGENILSDTVNPVTPTFESFRQPNPKSLPEKEESKAIEEIVPFATRTTDPQVAYIDLSKTIVPKEILHLIPEKIARQYKVVPIETTESSLTVAMVDPQDLEAEEIIKKMVPKELIIKLSSEDDVNHVLDQYSGLEKELVEAIKTADEEQTAGAKQDNRQKNNLIESASDNAPAARIVTSLLRRAIRDKASDIHIEPEEKDVLVRFRQDGVLRKTVTLPSDLRSSVVSRIKIMANMKIDEQRLPQDGRFSIIVDNRNVDFRVSTMPVANGEKVVMRVLDKLTGILNIEQLGITGGGLLRLQNNLKKSHGMILVTGPTGSGKTTTLYALIDKLYTEGVNIITLEDPIEYRMPGINQSQVHSEIDYTFASGLRSIVRQDPDIIMIGEIRDSETAEMAVHAALTGHIVLSTLHTNDSAGAAPRLLDMGVEPFLLTSSLNAVIAQRLARKICSDCKEELAVPAIEMEKIKVEIAKMPENERPKDVELKFYHGKGCKNCNNSGYKGRIGLYEVLEITEPLKELILKKESSFKLQELAIQNGMITMLGDGILKAIAGGTTLEEVWRITEE